MYSQSEETSVRPEVRDTLGRSMRDLRISVIDNCNLRCTYCMPLEKFGERYQFLREAQLLGFDEIERLTRLFVQLGISKVRITGGEPLLRKGLSELISRLAGIEGADDLALTTNGLLLGRHVGDLRAAGLTRLTVSLDSIDDGVFGAMNGRNLPAAGVLEGIRAAQSAGFSPIKINVVVQKGVNDHTMVDLAEYFRGRDCVVRFIEYMDVGNRNGWKLEQTLPSKELQQRLHERFPLTPLDRNYRGEVASRYAYADGAGEVGFISSVSEPFCSGCTRARLSADGRLYTCLFAGSGIDLRGLLRGGAADEEILECIRGSWSIRDDRYSDLRESRTDWEKYKQKVEMYHIGG